MQHSKIRPSGAALDPMVVRRRADRTAESFDAHDHVHRELARRLLEHLDPIRVAPERILELGCATGSLSRELVRRYPKCRVMAVDFSLRRLARSAAQTPRFFNRQSHLCADAVRLPLAQGSMDMVCANLLLPWIAEPARMLAECARVLRHGGLLLLSSLGPDTLRELRALMAGGPQRVHPLPDMHELADSLVGSGFSDVVADAEVLLAEYRGPADLLRELRQTGSTYAAPSRAGHLAAGSGLEHLRGATSPDPFSVSFEVVYVHAWFLDRRSVEVKLPDVRPGARNPARDA